MCNAWERNENCTRFLVWKSDRRRPLGRPKHRMEDGIRMYLRDMF
jgi:hypothetical protein